MQHYAFITAATVSMESPPLKCSVFGDRYFALGRLFSPVRSPNSFCGVYTVSVLLAPVEHIRFCRQPIEILAKQFFQWRHGARASGNRSASVHPASEDQSLGAAVRLQIKCRFARGLFLCIQCCRFFALTFVPLSVSYVPVDHPRQSCRRTNTARGPARKPFSRRNTRPPGQGSNRRDARSGKATRCSSIH